MRSYLTIAPIPAVILDEGGRRFITVPSDSIIELPEVFNDQGNGLVEVSVSGETVFMYAKDIRQRSKPAVC